MIKARALTVGSLKADSTPSPASVQSLIVFQKGHRREVEPVAHLTVLEAARLQRVPFLYKCEKGSCGVCSFHLVEGQDTLCPPQGVEQKWLQKNAHLADRLGCQALFR
jgi:ferredoxin